MADPDRQVAGALDEEHLGTLDVESLPIAALRAAGYAVTVDRVTPVVSEKAGAENTAYLVATVAVGGAAGEDHEGEEGAGDEADPRTVVLCHCWDFVARGFPDPARLQDGDATPADVGDCKHVAAVKRLAGDAGLRARENEGLDRVEGNGAPEDGDPR